MKFNFKIQQYQTDAVDSVVRVFQGQPSGVHGGEGTGNAAVALQDAELLANIREVQQDNNV